MKPIQKLKKTEIGEIPEDWNVENILNNSTLKARIGWQGLTTAEYLKNGDFFLVGGTDFKNSKIDWESCFYVEEKRYSQDKNIQLKKGDVLVTKDGTIGKIAYVDSLKLPATLNSGVFVIRPKHNNYNSQYLFFILSSDFFIKFLNKLKAGSTISHLYQKDFSSFDFLLPSTIKEQSAIASVLSDTDSLIESLHKLITKKKNIKQGTMQELLTGKIRLPGFKGEWEEKPIKDLILKQNKTFRKAGDGLTQGKYPFFTNSTTNFNTYLNEFDFEGESIIANTGGTAYFDYYKDKFAVMSDCFVFKTKEDSKFFYYKLKMIENYINDVGFTGSGIKHLDKKLFGNIILKIPKEKTEQSAIAEILSDMDLEIEQLERKRDKLKNIKTGMMQELLTGRIRLI